MSWFVTTNKGRKEIQVTDCWVPNDKLDPPKIKPCQTWQFIKMASEWDGSDLVQLFSILSGMEYKALRDTHDYVLEEQLLNATKFVYEEPMAFKDAKVPHWITINSRQVRIPAHIGGLSIGQSIHVRQALDKVKTWEELIAFVVAIYIQPIYDGEEYKETINKAVGMGFEKTQVTRMINADFDYHRAMELEQDILKMPITETYPLAFFLLRPIMKYGQNTLTRLNLLILRLQNLSTKRELE